MAYAAQFVNVAKNLLLLYISLNLLLIHIYYDITMRLAPFFFASIATAASVPTYQKTREACTAAQKRLEWRQMTVEN